MVSSDGEALLLTGNPDLATSPPYIRAPLEDRSKYEKLTQNNCVSSEYSSNDESEVNVKNNKLKKKRKIKNIPEKIQSVYKNVELPIVKNFMSDRGKNQNEKTVTRRKQKNESVDVVSDDSIGSASDLRVDEDVMGEAAIKKGDEISETISESIRTCGSSAYHAECESMATHEEDGVSRIIRTKQRYETKKIENQVESEDALFVGHQYGEKPLLLDDELDSDCELRIDNAKWSIEKKNQKSADLWIEPSSSFDDDVFALAPFPKSKVKKKTELQVNLKTQNFPDTEYSSVVEKDVTLIQETKTEISFDFPQNPQHENLPPMTINSNPFLSSEYLPENVINSSSTYGTVTVNSNIVNIDIPNNVQLNYYTEIHFPTDFSQAETYSDLQPSNTNFYEDVPVTSPTVDDRFTDFAEEAHKYFSEKLQNQMDLKADFQNSTSSQFLGNHNYKPKDNFQDTPFKSSNNSENKIPERKASTPEIVYKSKKDKKKDNKLKYHLIDETVPHENVGKSSKTGKNSAYKKVSNKTKKIGNKIKIQAGFSNMSFEDFPSDEGETVSHSVTPFEVLRSPEQEEKKYGSLKRISNPFS